MAEKTSMDVQIGKLGLTQELIDHIKVFIKQKKEVRLKFLKASRAEGRHELAKQIEEKVGPGKLIGNTYVIAAKK